MLHLNNYAGAIVSDSNTWFSPNGKYGFWRDSTTGPNSYFTSLDQWRSAMNADARSRTMIRGSMPRNSIGRSPAARRWTQEKHWPR